MKKKLILIYFVIGCVWTIVNLPNLLNKANNNVIKATLLAVFRIIAWPILSGNMLFGKIKQILAEKKAHIKSIETVYDANWAQIKLNAGPGSDAAMNSLMEEMNKSKMNKDVFEGINTSADESTIEDPTQPIDVQAIISENILKSTDISDVEKDIEEEIEAAMEDEEEAKAEEIEYIENIKFKTEEGGEK
jgi:hypothetical protein